MVRDYRTVTNRLTALGRRGWDLRVAGRVWGYPMYCVQRNRHERTPGVLLSAGLHGEEPAGVEAVLQWLESGQADRWRVRWLVMPCLNPYGWERNQRSNKQRCDINRQFRGRTDCPEANLAKRILRGCRFRISVEFHEDVDAAGYYLYELRHEPPYIGEAIVQRVRSAIRIHPGRVYDGNPSTGPGLIRRDPARGPMSKRRRWPMAYYLFEHHTGHCLGSETPVDAPMERRVRAHLVTLQAALELCSIPIM